jgi:hypothetical protein
MIKVMEPAMNIPNSNDNHESYFYINNPKTVGHYTVFPGLIIASYKRPSWWHRIMTRFLLGWVWVDDPFNV